MKYDLIINGAGPAGLMAAARAADAGLRVLLLERFDDITTIRRACCQQFVMDEDYENENIIVEPERIVFPANGFEVAYSGPLHDITETCFTSVAGRTVRFQYPDNRAVAIKFDKGKLLGGLLDECLRLGVDYRNAMQVSDCVDHGTHVSVHAVDNGQSVEFQATKLIAADGVNSRTLTSLGMNDERTHFATALCIIYSLEGVTGFDPSVMKWHMGMAYGSYAPVILDPSLRGSGIADLVVMGSEQQRPDKIFEDFTRNSPAAAQFSNARIVDRSACTVKALTSLKVPWRGNVLAIGDAAAYVEVEVQGGLMCGYHAARAVVDELQNTSGFERYTQWWQSSFEFNSPEALCVAQGYALVPTYTDEEIDYLFALLEDTTLDGAYGQYKAPRLVWDAIMKNRDAIEAERPELVEKFKNNAKMTLADTFSQTERK
jgi:digeranylgeranylglycerophospholipid reductase